MVKDVSFTFKPGIANLIIGESGCGKTTIVKLMVGLHPLDSGQVLYKGSDFPRLDRAGQMEIRKQIG